MYAFLRLATGATPLLVVCNFTPVPRNGYRIGVPQPGRWREVLNTDSELYGGSNVGNSGAVQTEEQSAHGEAESLVLTLPPLATLVLRHDARSR